MRAVPIPRALILLLLIAVPLAAGGLAAQQVADTKFAPDRGFYPSALSVTIRSETPGALVSYSTDGSPPTASGGQPSPVTVNLTRSTPLRAIAYVADGSLEPTNIDTHTYIILDAPLRWNGTSLGTSSAYPSAVIDSLASLPALFVSLRPSDFATVRDSGTGNIGQSGGNEAYERPCSAELWYPDHPRYTGFEGFQIDAGLRPHSWVTTKRAFRLYFKTVYGPGKLRYPIFESAPWAGESAVDEFDKLVLRNHSNDGWESRWGGADEALYLRDQFARACQIDMGGIGSRSIWVHLFVNGGYYGLYNPSERPDDDFLASYLGGEDSDWLAFNHGGVINAGADTSIYNLYRNPGNLSTAAAYEAFKSALNPAQFSDYLISSWFNTTHSHDWPVNGSSPQNFYGGNRNNPPQGTLHLTWDFEAALFWDATVHAKFRRSSTDGDKVFIRTWFALVQNNDFLRLFADRAYAHLFNGGALSPTESQARLDAMGKHVQPALAAEKWQWGGEHDFWQSHFNAARAKLATNPGNLLASLRAESYYPNMNSPVFRNAGADIVVPRRIVPPGFQVALVNPNGTTGSIFYTLDGSDPTGAGATDGGDAATITVTQTTVLKARVRNGTEWSALHELTLHVAGSFNGLRISEVMYHPAGEDGDRFEFVEIENSGAQALDLSGVTFSKGVDFTFPDGFVLPAGGFAVLTKQPWDFVTRHPGVPVAGEFLRGLDNNGEKVEIAFTDGARHAATSLSSGGLIQLAALPEGIAVGDRVRVTGCERVTNNGSYLIDAITGTQLQVGKDFSDAPEGARLQFFKVIDGIDYTDRAPWPLAADGYGFSLVRDGGLWRASAVSGGSPGAADPPPSPAPALLVNEALTNTDPPQLDAIEIFNPTGTAVDLGGWWLTDDASLPGKFAIPVGTMIEPGGYRVFDASHFGSAFLLASTGEEVYLSSPDFRYTHGFAFGASENGVSFGRHVTSTGAEHFVRQATLTLGSPNSAPRVGPVVISEIHYHPAGAGFEFLELLNISASPVDLGGWELSGLGFTFPASTLLQPNGVLILDGNPASAIGLPVSGKLDNAGERLRLRMPGGVVVDAVHYDDKAPWPTTPDGQGPSLERILPGGYGDDPANWRASALAGGSPGQSVPPTTPIIAFEPAAIQRTIIEGFNPAPINLDVWNVGIGTLVHTLGESVPWLSVAPDGGTSTGAADRENHTLVFSAAGLAPGIHSTTVTVTGNAANSPATLPVQLVVEARDLTPPTLVSATAVNASALVVVFSEPVNGATNPANFSLSDGASVLGATMSADGRTVTLATSGLLPGTLHTLGVTGITDRALPTANPLAPGTQITFFFQGTSLPDGLVASWSFDEGSGGSAGDSEGGNTLTLNQSPLWVDGHDGAAVCFNGSSQFATRADAQLTGPFPCASGGGAASFTMAAWIRLDLTGHRHPITTKQGNEIRGLLWSVEENNRLTLELFKNQSDKTTTQGNTPLQASRWYHVAVTYEFIADGTSRVRLYLDGQEDADGNNAVGPPTPNALDFQIGRYWWNSSYSRYFAGCVDGFLLFGRALDATEIAQVASGVAPAVATPVIQPSGGDFSAPVTVSITSPTPGALVFYSLDGSEPTAASTPYDTPFTVAETTTVRARAYKAGANPSDAVAATFTRVQTSGDWWNTALPFRVALTVSSGPYARRDQHCAEIPLDLAALGAIPDSVRVVEVGPAGQLLDAAPAFQVEPGENLLVLALAGDTPAQSTRHYQAYYATTDTHAPPSFAPLVQTDPNSSDGGLASLRIQTGIGTWHYHYAGAGFSSLDDTNGNDWIGWSTAAGANGAYRGIPNLAHDSAYFHPGDDGNPSTTTLERGGPVRATLRSISEDTLWELRWDIFPVYARLTVVRRNPAEAYWFLYEGTPGGNLSATNDFSVRPNGTRLPLGTAWTGDLPGEEWAYFEDSGLNRALYVIQHQPDANTDSYWTLGNAMTVFGFGRLDLNSYLTATPNVFTVGLADDASFANMSGVIDSAYRPLATTTSLPQAIPGRATYLAWAATQFDPATLADPALEDSNWGPDADPEGDGITNLLELVTGGDPHAPNPAPLAIESVGDDTFTIRFDAQRDLPGIRVTLNLSPALADWQPTTADWQPAGPPNAWRVTLPADLPARFARLNASLDE